MNKTVITFDTFKNLVAKICRDITVSNWKPDYIVGITRGGLFPAVMISHYFKVPCDTLKVSLRDDTAECESNLWMAEDAFGYSADPKNILIVDDINDTGATINWIIKDWQSGCLPNDERWNTVWNQNVRFATIVDNLSSKAKVKIDYTAHEINKAENDVWIEFPYEDWWTK